MACASNILQSLPTSVWTCWTCWTSPPVPVSPWTAAAVVFRSPRRCLCTEDTSWPVAACRSASWCRPSSWCSSCSGFYWTYGRWGAKVAEQKKNGLKIISYNNNFLIWRIETQTIQSNCHRAPQKKKKKESWLRPAFPLLCVFWPTGGAVASSGRIPSVWDYLG